AFGQQPNPPPTPHNLQFWLAARTIAFRLESVRSACVLALARSGRAFRLLRTYTHKRPLLQGKVLLRLAGSFRRLRVVDLTVSLAHLFVAPRDNGAFSLCSCMRGQHPRRR